MRSSCDSEENIMRIAEQEIRRNPQSKMLVNAFLPLFIKRYQFLAADEPTATGEPFVLDDLRFTGGIPLIDQQSLFYRDDPWEEMVNTVTSALNEGFPAIKNDLERFEYAVQKGEIVPYNFFQRRAKRQQIIINDWSMDIRVSPLRLAFILSQIERIALERRRKSLDRALNEAVWTKGYCPVCGTFPAIAVMNENGEARQLHCFQCGQDWYFSSAFCPRCECSGDNEIPIFCFEDNDESSAFACEECKSYLLTIRQLDDLTEYNLDLSTIGLTHLDLIMQREGYLPMISFGWNLFPSSSLWPEENH